MPASGTSFAGRGSMIEAIRNFVTHPVAIGTWLALDAVALVILLVDFKRRNPEIMSLMKVVWTLTVLYSGFIGLAIYWFTGRKQISRDSLWRKGFRSTAHCYSGCGAGEIAGVLIAIGVFSFGNIGVSILTFSLAYVAGFGLTMGPLMQDGEGFGAALKDAAYSETASIAVMEIVAVGVDLWLAGNAKMNEPLFWSSLVVSLTLGLAAAYPVNLLLIKFGIKEGMHNPKEMAKHAHEDSHEGGHEQAGQTG